ncbi:MAG: glycosyltransferase family 4 protein, partial [Spirochaetes bacterium]|nr:glycosyltransferase family 4 protein [Spirochaetota bacterium]
YGDFRILESMETDRFLWAANLPRLFDLSAFDLLYIPYNTPPLGELPCPFVITIHDTIPGVPFSRDGFFHPSLMSMLNIEEYARMKRELKASRRATWITTDSHNAKADILKRMDYPAEKIDVIYININQDFKSVSQEEITAVKKKYAIEGEYLFYLGGIRARKNIRGLIMAYAMLPLSLRNKYSLIIAGSLNDGLRKLVHRKKLEGYVFEIGMVPERDVTALYSGAKLFTFLSFYEGFGLPPVEAATCGIPSLVSNTSSLPEVTEGFALTVSPFHQKQIARQLELLLTDSEVYAKLKQGCSNVHERFSREKIHQQLMGVFEKAVSR